MSHCSDLSCVAITFSPVFSPAVLFYAAVSCSVLCPVLGSNPKGLAHFLCTHRNFDDDKTCTVLWRCKWAQRTPSGLSDITIHYLETHQAHVISENVEIAPSVLVPMSQIRSRIAFASGRAPTTLGGTKIEMRHGTHGKQDFIHDNDISLPHSNSIEENTHSRCPIDSRRKLKNRHHQKEGCGRERLSLSHF